MHLRARLLFVLLLPLSLWAQTDSLPAFPQDFIGNWAGELDIFNREGKRQSVPMQLLIQPVADSAYSYTIIYGTDLEAGKRDYYLIPGSDGPHHWVCDEKNTILLDGYYLGGIYQSVFKLNDIWLTSALEHRGDHLIYAIFSGKTTAIRTTGGQQHEGEDIPSVESFLVSAHQRAKLYRQE